MQKIYDNPDEDYWIGGKKSKNLAIRKTLEGISVSPKNFGKSKMFTSLPCSAKRKLKISHEIKDTYCNLNLKIMHFYNI